MKVGDIVLTVSVKGSFVPAIVTKVRDTDTVDLVVFDASIDPHGTQARERCKLKRSGESFGPYHWTYRE